MIKYKSKLNNILNNHLFMLSLQLFLIGVLSFFLFDSVLAKEIFKIFDVANITYLKNPVATGLFLFKTISNISGIYTLLVVSLELLAMFLIVSAFIIMFVHFISFINFNETSTNYNHEAIITANYAGLYKVQSKYLC